MRKVLIVCAMLSIPGLGGWTGRNMEYLYALLAIGVVLMLYARWRGESRYFDQPLEAFDPVAAGADPLER